MMKREPRFTLRNSIIRDPDGKIKFRKSSAEGYEHYHVGVWLESADPTDLQDVTHVEYELHPTFIRRFRRSSNRSNSFSITFWSWGTFEITAQVHMQDRDTPITVTHELEYDLPAGDDNYVDVTPPKND